MVQMGKYKIIEADIKKDKDQITSLLKSDNRTISNEIYNWKYLDYPYGTPRAWLLIYKATGNRVGSGSLFPRKICINGKIVNVGTLGDLTVEERHRTLFPALQLEKEIITQFKKTKYNFIYSQSNIRTKPIFYRLNYKKIANYQFFIKILNFSNLPDTYMPIPLNFKFIRKTLDLFWSISLKRIIFKIRNKYKTEMLESFDDRFNIFYNSISKYYNIIGDRRKYYLNWRYTSNPIYKYTTFCLTDKKNKILGYIIYRILENTFYIEDIVSFPNKYQTLLFEFIQFAKDNEISAIELRYMGNMDFIKMLKKYLFITIDKKSNEILLYSKHIDNNIDLLNNENWHFLIHDKNV